MEIRVQQNIEFPMKDFDNHGTQFLETSYAVSLFFMRNIRANVFLVIQKCAL